MSVHGQPNCNPTGPDRDYGPLEVVNDDDRKLFHDCLEQLLNTESCYLRQGVVEDRYSEATRNARKRLLISVAELLLGPDFEYTMRT